MKISQETILKFWKQYQGQTITIAVPPFPDDDTGGDVDNGNTYPLPSTDYLYDASDNDKHLGEWCLLLDKRFAGRTATVFVGDEEYIFDRIYLDGRPVYYGKHNPGCIVVTLKDGDVYTSEEQGEGQTVNSDKPWHHINFQAWRGKGTALVLCEGSRAKSVTIAGRKLEQHGSMDKNREVWTDYGATNLDGLVEIIFSTGRIWRSYIKSNGSVLYGDCK